MKIQKGHRVRMRVHLATNDGKTIEKTAVDFVFGAGKMMPGLEQEILGLEPGAKKNGTIPAARAFGDPSTSPTKTISKKEFPADTKLEVGTQFAAKGADGTDVVLRVTKVVGDSVEVRFLHPLAEQDIRYEVEILGVVDGSIAPPPMPAKAMALEE